MINDKTEKIISQFPSDEQIKEQFTTTHKPWKEAAYKKVRNDRIFGAKWMKEIICIILRNNGISDNLLIRSKQIELLEEYTKFLQKNGYIDTDATDEEPYAIDEFMLNKK